MATEKAIQMPNFEKLNGDNYTMWRMQFMAFLELHQLIGIVEGTDVMPEEKADEIVKWSTRNSTVKFAILQQLIRTSKSS